MFFKKNSDNPRDIIVAYKNTFSTAFGKQVLLDLMNKNNVLNTHKGDVFQEGKRAVVLEILHLCNVNMEEFEKLLKGE